MNEEQDDQVVKAPAHGSEGLRFNLEGTPCDAVIIILMINQTITHTFMSLILNPDILSFE